MLDPRGTLDHPAARGPLLARRRAVQALAAAGAVGVGATLGLAGLLLADRVGADEEDGRPLHLQTFGAGERMVAFLPGHGLTTRYFASRVAPLATRHRVALVDLLGFGRSPKPWTRYTVDRHVAELRRVLAPLGPLTLVGHSLGARLAVTYAARYPDQAQRLVLLSLPYFGGGAEAYRYFAHGELPGRWVATRTPLTAAACVLIRRVLHPLLPRLEPDLPREVLDDLRLHHWQSDVSTLRECVYGYDLPADVARLAAGLPVLCLHGSADRSAPLDGVRRFAAQHRNTTVRVFDGADHHPLLRAPAECIAAMDAAVGGDESRERVHAAGTG